MLFRDTSQKKNKIEEDGHSRNPDVGTEVVRQYEWNLTSRGFVGKYDIGWVSESDSVDRVLSVWKRDLLTTKTSKTTMTTYGGSPTWNDNGDNDYGRGTSLVKG